MRGREQHVERKIRLWVVQQERNRVSERSSERPDARADERTERLQLEAAARANKTLSVAPRPEVIPRRSSAVERAVG